MKMQLTPQFPIRVTSNDGSIIPTFTNGVLDLSRGASPADQFHFLYGALHGIVADGVTDNKTALAALQALAIAQNKIIVLPGGTIFTSQNFTLTGHLMIQGLGYRVTTLSFGAGAGIVTGSYTINLSDLNIVTTGTGLFIGDDANDNFHSTVFRTNFSNCGTGIKVTNGQITRILESGFACTQQGILITAPLNSDAGDCLIDGCWFIANGGAAGGASNAAILHEGGGGWKITNNKMIGGNRGYWQHANYINATLSMSSLIITDNSIEGNAIAGIVISSQSTIANDLFNVVIANNQTGGEQAGILIEATGGRQWIHGAAISGNFIRMDAAPAPGYSIDGVKALNLEGGGISSFAANTTAIIIGSHCTGVVDIPTIDNFTTPYTNGSAGVSIRNGNDPWTPYTPVVTAAAGAFTSVSATGRWTQKDKTIFFEMTITDTTNGTAANAILATLPAVTTAPFTFVGTETTTFKGLTALVGSGLSQLSIRFYDATYPGADGRVFTVNGTYETP